MRRSVHPVISFVYRCQRMRPEGNMFWARTHGSLRKFFVRRTTVEAIVDREMVPHRRFYYRRPRSPQNRRNRGSYPIPKLVRIDRQNPRRVSRRRGASHPRHRCSLVETLRAIFDCNDGQLPSQFSSYFARVIGRPVVNHYDDIDTLFDQMTDRRRDPPFFILGHHDRPDGAAGIMIDKKILDPPCPTSSSPRQRVQFL